MSTSNSFISGSSPRMVWVDHSGQEQAISVAVLQIEVRTMHQALHDIVEEWNCYPGWFGEPVHAQEADAIELAKRMYHLAIKGMSKP